MTPKLYIPLMIFISFLIGCKPKHHMDSYVVNNSNDTLLFTNSNTIEPLFILPGETSGIYLDQLYQKSNPEKKLKCCPCEIGTDKFTIKVKNANKTLLKNPNEANNWVKPTIIGKKLSKEITCIFEIYPEDIQ